MLFICVLAAFNSMAQQPVDKKLSNSLAQASGINMANYTYKVFQAPNKMYGYDIFRNDKILFHQPPAFQSNNLIAPIAKKEQAEKAALLTIEKVKKNEAPALTQKEIEKILSD
jgi:hypothetical protein